MARPPLSVRQDSAATDQYYALVEGIPPWMRASALAWVKPFIYTDKGVPIAKVLHRVEQHLRIQLSWAGALDAHRVTSAAINALDLLHDDEAGLDLLDYFLGTCSTSSTSPERLQAILDASASAWTVGRDDEGLLCLERRVDPVAQASAESEMEKPGKAAIYLRSAWHDAFGRDPNPTGAYRDAIRAVEAAARPVLTPADQLATLGKMIAAIRDAPTKWTVEIGDIGAVKAMMETVWKNQHDRHGTDDETTPVNVSQSEAEAALFIAVTLVQWFRSGFVRLA
ncbi:MAG: hypothetical protein AB7L17_16945 [Ilumatobacteraceae bacterium]